MKLLNIFFLILFSAFACYTLFDALRRKTLSCTEIPVQNQNKQLCFTVLVIALAVGVGIRLLRFGIVPVGVNQDGAMAAVDGKALADYGTDRFGTRLPAHLYAWGYGQMSSLLSYLIAFWVKLFGLSAVTMRLPQLLSSIAGGAFFYLFARDVFGRKAGLIAAVFAAINPWHFVQSRWALDCNLLPHFLMCALWLLKKGSDGKKLYVYLSMVVFGLSMYCYGIALYSVPLMMLLSCIMLLRRRCVTFGEVLICSVIFLAVSWPFILTMAINYFGWETVELPFVTCQRFYDSVRSSDILFFSDNLLPQLKANILSLINVVFLQYEDLLWNNIPYFGSMYIFTIPFEVLGLIRLIGLCRSRNVGGYLALFFLFNGIWVGITTNGVNINRVNSAFYPVMLLCVLGIEWVIERSRFMRISVIAVYALSAILMVGAYFGSYSESLADCFYDGFGDALAAAESTGAEIICITDSVQYEGSANVSEILTLFYDRTDAEYFQGKTNNNKGEELLPYNERFRYVRAAYVSEEQYTDHQTVFVILEYERQYFSDTDFVIIPFGDYCTVIPR